MLWEPRGEKAAAKEIELKGWDLWDQASDLQRHLWTDFPSWADSTKERDELLQASEREPVQEETRSTYDLRIEDIPDSPSDEEPYDQETNDSIIREESRFDSIRLFDSINRLFV